MNNREVVEKFFLESWELFISSDEARKEVLTVFDEMIAETAERPRLAAYLKQIKAAFLESENI